ncbi:MAG: putative toxin-antitoxin system toxin component, PIN family, partial [bacterium]|nr:putative toxin-antitoxin system toxin component, PIN family [bacterium]
TPWAFYPTYNLQLTTYYPQIFFMKSIVSAAIKKSSLPALLLTLFIKGKIELFVSSALLAEYEEVLRRAKFGLSRQAVDELINQIKEKAIVVKPLREITRIKDIPDNRVLECAAQAKVSYIVTGNKHHFTVSSSNLMGICCKL